LTKKITQGLQFYFSIRVSHNFRIFHSEIDTRKHFESCTTGGTGRMKSSANLYGMKTILVLSTFRATPLLAQAATGSLTQGASSALGIVMLIGFLFGTLCVIGGGFAIRRGDTDAGKLSIIGGLIIAGAPVIVKALFTAFGNSGSTVDVGTFQ
jgi:hypothetical protein